MAGQAGPSRRFLLELDGNVRAIAGAAYRERRS